MGNGPLITWLDLGLPVITALVVLFVGVHVGRIDARNKKEQDENIKEHDRFEARLEELARTQRECAEDHFRRGARLQDIADLKAGQQAIFDRLNGMATMSAIEDLRSRMNNLEAALITIARNGNGKP